MAAVFLPGLGRFINTSKLKGTFVLGELRFGSECNSLTFENLTDDMVEGPLGLLSVLGASLEVLDLGQWNAYKYLSGGLLGLHTGHSTVMLQVALVADEEQLHPGDIGVLIELADPVTNSFEGLFVGDVEDEQDSVAVLVVGGRDGTETLSASRIPNYFTHGVLCTRTGVSLR